MREARLKKKNGGERRIVCEKENKKFLCYFGIHQLFCYMEWGTEREKKKIFPTFHFEEN